MNDLHHFMMGSSVQSLNFHFVSQNFTFHLALITVFPYTLILQLIMKQPF